MPGLNLGAADHEEARTLDDREQPSARATDTGRMIPEAPYRSSSLTSPAVSPEPRLGPSRRELAAMVVSFASIGFVVSGLPIAIVLLGESAMWLGLAAFLIGATSLGVGSWLSNRSYYAAVDARALRAIEKVEEP